MLWFENKVGTRLLTLVVRVLLLGGGEGLPYDGVSARRGGDGPCFIAELLPAAYENHGSCFSANYGRGNGKDREGIVKGTGASGTCRLLTFLGTS